MQTENESENASRPGHKMLGRVLDIMTCTLALTGLKKIGHNDDRKAP